MRSLQLFLRQQWDFIDKSVVLSWSPEVELGLAWWSDASHLLWGVPLLFPELDILFWFDASDHDWGANLLDRFISGQWSREEDGLSKNLRETGDLLGATPLCFFAEGSHR